MNKQRYYALVIRYFCGGIKTRILRLLEQASEKSIDMTELISEALKINGLDLKKMVALTADNTNANFGGINRGGSNNLFYLLKQENPKLVGIGCPSHISSNAVQFAVEQMEYDLLGFANGLTAHFSNHALRWERFHECAQVLGIYYRLPNVYEKNLHGNLANANEFKVLFYFASFTLDHFNRFNATSQTLKRRLAFSRDDGYYGDQTMRLLAEMEKDGEFDMCLKLKSAFKKFYDDSLSYMNKWCVHLEDIATFFGIVPNHGYRTNISAIVFKRFLQELDNLFGEIAEMNETLEQLQGTEFDSKSVEEKWSILFKNPNFILLKKLVSILLSVFSSNAFCESIFSVVKNLKSDERNRMQLKLLNSLLSIKFNADFDCVKAHELFLSRTDLLEEVKRGEKYVQ
uniref:HAT C-terminal dimerisation domain-containing protein n=1 Tax=Ditylenchus dipsaci TaxID=166011 RepID=A0A915DCA3_9BILA